MQNVTSLQFIPTDGVSGTFSGQISGSRPIKQYGYGTTIFAGSNNYTGATTIMKGALQANSGTGLPAASQLVLSGGVLQGNGAVTFSRTLSNTTGSNKFYWAGNGGFSANGGQMTVRINNGTSTLTWGSTAGSQIVGTLMLSSTTANAVTIFQNGINLNAGNPHHPSRRTIPIRPPTTAQITGNISGTGTASSLDEAPAMEDCG